MCNVGTCNQRHIIARTRVTEDHFQVDENEVIQTPTGACWTAYPGRPEPHLCSAGMLGSLLPSGEDYIREFESFTGQPDQRDRIANADHILNEIRTVLSTVQTKVVAGRDILIF